MFKWLINIITSQANQLGIIEDFIMTDFFSQEQLAQLDKELQFTLRCIGVLTRDFNYHRAHTGQDAAYKALEDFKTDKLKLEIKIQMLSEFLEVDEDESE
jgi:hypothetical protein